MDTKLRDRISRLTPDDQRHRRILALCDCRSIASVLIALADALPVQRAILEHSIADILNEPDL